MPLVIDSGDFLKTFTCACACVRRQSLRLLLHSSKQNRRIWLHHCSANKRSVLGFMTGTQMIAMSGLYG